MYKTIILPVVLYGYETWSLTLWEEHRLRVFENRVLRGIFGTTGVEVTGDWRQLHSGQLHNLCSSPDIIRHIKSRGMMWAEHVHARGRGETCTGFRWESPKEKGNSKKQGVNGRMGLEWIFGRPAEVCGVDSTGSG
jgi:hypothetical protein